MSRILIVEDAEVDRVLVTALLAGAEDLEVECAVNGRAALLAIEQQAPDLVVTDLMMPEMGGLELVSTVKDRYPLLPVIIMTSKGSEETAVQALEQGAASYVPKHTLAHSLLDTIETVLAASVQRRKRASLMQVMVNSHSSFVFGNDRALFRPLIQFLQDSMSEFGLFDEMERTRISVAIEEALNNAAEHGNLELDSSLRDVDLKAYLQLLRERCQLDRYRRRRIYFDARFTPDEVVFEIRDEGPGFDPGAVPDPTASAALDTTSGRGLTLMRMFMDEVAYNDAGNQVRMTKRRASEAVSRPG